MKIAFVIFILTCVNFLPHHSYASEVQCDELLTFEKEMSSKLPLQVDEVTQVVEVRVNCELKSVTYIKHLSVDKDELAIGVADRKQRQYINLHCNNEGLARSGWHVNDYIYDKNLELLMKLKANPEDCILQE